VRSIRTTLVVTSLLGIGITITIVGVVVFERVQSALVTQFDRAVAAKARSIGAQLELEGSRVEFHYVPGLLTEFEGGAAPEYFQLSNSKGAILDRSTTLADGALPILAGPTEAPAHFDVVLPDGRAGRAAGVSIILESPNAPPLQDGAVDDRPRVVVVVARGREDIDEALASVRATFLSASAATLGLVALVILLATWRGLSPLEALAREVAALDETTLDTQLGAEKMPREVSSIVRKLNELLARLANALARERRMTANLAHELRTPVAELRAAIEVAHRWPDDTTLRTAALDTAQSVANRMTTLVSALLRLARVTAGTADPAHDEFDFGSLIAEAIASVDQECGERAVRLTETAVSPVTLRTDRALLAMAVHNIVANAARFAPHGTTIESVLTFDGATSTARWSLSNAVNGLDAADRENLAEPFWQKDAARSDGRHAGLGLSLVKTIAAALDAKIDFEIGDAFTVHLSLAASNLASAGSRTPSGAPGAESRKAVI
jgi:two-component system, OmpR family, sensor histidine kinase QseC